MAVPRSIVLVVVAVALTLGATPGAVASGPPTPAERMVERINDARGKHGLRPLRVAPRLARTARGYARKLIRTSRFTHGSTHTRVGFRRSGEILALRSGRSRRPAPFLRMWLRSRGHAALILNPRFRYIGTSAARGSFNGRSTTIWVTHFGAP